MMLASPLLTVGADPITADAARILRMPGTHNFRDPDNPVKAELYETKAGYIDLDVFHAAVKAAFGASQAAAGPLIIFVYTTNH